MLELLYDTWWIGSIWRICTFRIPLQQVACEWADSRFLVQNLIQTVADVVAAGSPRNRNRSWSLHLGVLASRNTIPPSIRDPDPPRWEHQPGHKPFNSCSELIIWGKFWVSQSLLMSILKSDYFFGGGRGGSCTIKNTAIFCVAKWKMEMFENWGAPSYAVSWCFMVSVESGKAFLGVPHSRGTQILAAMAAMLRGLLESTSIHQYLHLGCFCHASSLKLILCPMDFLWLLAVQILKSLVLFELWWRRQTWPFVILCE